MPYLKIKPNIFILIIFLLIQTFVVKADIVASQDSNLKTEVSKTTGNNKDVEVDEDSDSESSNSFYLLWEAFKNSRRSIWASVQVLIVITIILATIFYFAETSVQPKEYSYRRSLLWAFTRYIGDPGKLAGPGPKSMTGRIVATMIGVVGILIFAVPAGLIATGFRAAIEQDIHKDHISNISKRIEKSYSRAQDPVYLYRYVPRFISLGTLKVNQHLTEQDVLDAVEYNSNFRLRNLEVAETKGSHAVDRIVVEMFPLNTSYGAKIDRGSNITIACPSSSSEPGIGNFGYYLALIGGFNYISKELEPVLDEKISYYLIDDETDQPQQRAEYLADLKKLSAGENNWTIFLIISDRESEYTMHFVTYTLPETNISSSVLDTLTFNKLFDTFAERLDEKYEIKSDLNLVYRPQRNNYSSIKIGGGRTTNAISIRVDSEFVVWDPKYIGVCKDMADIINEIVGDPSKATPEEILKEKGYGFIY